LENSLREVLVCEGKPDERLTEQEVRRSGKK